MGAHFGLLFYSPFPLKPRELSLTFFYLSSDILLFLALFKFGFLVLRIFFFTFSTAFVDN